MDADIQGPTAPRNHTRPMAVFVGAFLLAVLLDQAWPFWLDANSPDWPRGIAGGAACVLGAVLVIRCLSIFERLGTGIMPDRPATHLVTSGPYALSRHPMFLGFASMYGGLALVFNLAWPLLLLPAVLLVLNLTVVRCEERYLRRRFGSAYDQYAARVQRWL